jgi:hypothetical protein
MRGRFEKYILADLSSEMLGTNRDVGAARLRTPKSLLALVVQAPSATIQ